MFFVNRLVTEAVAWEVAASGNVEGTKSLGGGRILGFEIEDDNDRDAESCFSLSIAKAWSSIKIFLNDVAARFGGVSLSEELFGEGSSSIGVVSVLDEKAGEVD